MPILNTSSLQSIWPTTKKLTPMSLSMDTLPLGSTSMEHNSIMKDKEMVKQSKNGWIKSFKPNSIKHNLSTNQNNPSQQSSASQKIMFFKDQPSSSPDIPSTPLKDHNSKLLFKTINLHNTLEIKTLMLSTTGFKKKLKKYSSMLLNQPPAENSIEHLKTKLLSYSSSTVTTQMQPTSPSNSLQVSVKTNLITSAELPQKETKNTMPSTTGSKIPSKKKADFCISPQKSLKNICMKMNSLILELKKSKNSSSWLKTDRSLPMEHPQSHNKSNHRKEKAKLVQKLTKYKLKQLKGKKLKLPSNKCQTLKSNLLNKTSRLENLLPKNFDRQLSL